MNAQSTLDRAPVDGSPTTDADNETWSNLTMRMAGARAAGDSAALLTPTASGVLQRSAESAVSTLSTATRARGDHPSRPFPPVGPAQGERPFRRVVIVSNPHASGNGPGNARWLARGLSDLAPDLPVEVVESRYPGHAVSLARTAAAAAPATLVISASGDGGYHEVVNGALQSVAAGHRDTFTAVLPSGNANDHASLSRRPLLEAITAGDVTGLDVLAFEVEGRPVRYAHSYIGLGLSPAVADDLNRHPTGRVGEVWSAMTALARHEPVQIGYNGAVAEVDSLLFANIARMAKYLKLSTAGSATDGRFEMILTNANRRRTTLAADVLRALTGHLSPTSRSKPFDFTLIRAARVQLDGEVTDLPAGARISVSCQPRALQSVR